MVAPPLAFFSGPLPWVVLALLTVFFLWIDLHFFARGREPQFREGLIWSIGWLVLSLLAAVVVLAVFIAQQVVAEGESTWFEGLQLLAVYAVLGLTFYFV